MVGQRRRRIPVAAIAVAIAGGALIAPRPALGAKATQVTGGTFHTCALTAGGGVKCWGENVNGGLGDGTVRPRLRPASVNDLAGGVIQIAAGFSHTCALTAGGGVTCWGNNYDGELGDGTRTERHAPVSVLGLASGVAQIVAGFDHTCALTIGGGVKCWGGNYFGQLGDGTTRRRLTPVDVTGLASGVNQITTRREHTCALTSAGGAKCWGDNEFGAIGDGTRAERHTPVDVVGLASGVIQISAGESHTCAVIAAGTVKCWGYNGASQLGDDTSTDRYTPVDVVGLADIVQVSAGGIHTCALTVGGGATCWGNNGFGQLGDGTTIERHHAVSVRGMASGVGQVEASDEHTCAVTIGGGAKCWGWNYDGQLGDNTRSDRRVPSFVYGFGGIRTSTTLLSSLPRARTGQAITFTAKVAPTPAGGNLTFANRNGAIPGCWRIPIVNGRARCTVHYKRAGLRRIAALYLGSVVHKASRSAQLVQVVT
jgi:alpha-tubulin suppressor-like RCC1 family protein